MARHIIISSSSAAGKKRARREGLRAPLIVFGQQKESEVKTESESRHTAVAA